MGTLASPRQTVEILNKFGVKADKRYGQNFLVDPNILSKITRIAGLTASDVVLEIGPGIGALTQALASQVKLVIAIEYDRALEPVLTETLRDYSNLKLFFEDALKLDCAAFFRDIPRPNKMVSNLPYNIATPLLCKFLEECSFIQELVVTVQKEVAERLVGRPGTKSYGSLSLKVGYFTEPKLIATISKNAFFPAPKVSSSVVKMKRVSPPVSIDDRARFFRLIEDAFAQRRKKIINSLMSSRYFEASRAEWEKAVLAAGLSSDARAETLNLTDFARLYEKIRKIVPQGS